MNENNLENERTLKTFSYGRFLFLEIIIIIHRYPHNAFFKNIQIRLKL